MIKKKKKRNQICIYDMRILFIKNPCLYGVKN